MPKYYAVAKGRETGIFSGWEKTEKHVKDFPYAMYKSFTNKKKAQAYMNEKAATVNDPVLPVDSNFLYFLKANSKEKLSDFQHVWLGVEYEGWGIYFPDTKEILYDVVETRKHASVKLLLTVLKYIVASPRKENEKWLILNNDLITTQSILFLAPKWEENGFVKASGKPVKHRELLVEIRDNMRILGSLGVTVAFDIALRYSYNNDSLVVSKFVEKRRNDNLFYSSFDPRMHGAMVTQWVE